MKPNKLRTSSEFEKVYKSGQKYWNRNFVLYVLHHKLCHEVGHFRVGLTVSKKVGKSVQRNRVKRLIREFLRLLESEFNNGCDLVIVAQNSAADLNFYQTQQSLLHLFKRAGILKKSV